MVMKKILIALALLLTGIASGSACTGISFLAEDYVNSLSARE